MQPGQRFIGFIAVASLLCGNVAGWIHVAAHHSPASVGATSESAAVIVCPCHAHRARALHRDGAETPPSGESLPGDHDSDRCSVCQAFAVQRGLTVLPDSAVGRVDSLPAQACPLESMAGLISERHESISVRGPPHA